MKKLSIIFVLLFSIFVFTTPTDAAGSSQLIIINKKINTLAFYDGGKLVKTFKVATGKIRNLTPEGKFRIVIKMVNRPYYKGHIPGGDPRNPLGDRWMGLEARGTYGTTYGIHGNANESSIGKYVSHGCVRMHNQEIRWLYSRVQNYTPVVITYSTSSFDAIAKANGVKVNVPNGWVQKNGHRYYYVNGTLKYGWFTISGKKYFFDHTGAMRTGWVITGGKKYYLDPTGVMKTGWLVSGGKKYYLDPSGVMRTGWLVTGGKKYYLDPSGVMRTGLVVNGGKKYYLDPSGAMKTGWVRIDGKSYYFYPYPNGNMAVNTVIDGRKIGPDGAWQQVQYVALGDSLAAGMTPLGVDRVPVNGVDLDWGYPNYLAESLKMEFDLVDFDNFGVSGSKTSDVIAQLNKPDVQKEIKEATHVTIDIGANDILPVIQQKDSTVAQAQGAIAATAANINTILSKIDQLNPKVKVYVMGYYNPFPYLTDAQQKEQLDQLLLGFNGQIQAQAVQHGDTFVPTAQVINVTDFQNYLPNPQNIHLSLLGYQVVAGEFWKVIK